VSNLSKITKTTLQTTLALASNFLINPVGTVFAAKDTVDITTGVTFDTIKNLKPSGFVSTAINLLLGVSGIISFFMLLWGGIQWILAGGDKEGTEKARKRITSALIGLAIVFSAYALIFIIKALFGIDIIKFDLNPIPPTSSG
jgi:hypothetical protein